MRLQSGSELLANMLNRLRAMLLEHLNETFDAELLLLRPHQLRNAIGVHDKEITRIERIHRVGICYIRKEAHHHSACLEPVRRSVAHDDQRITIPSTHIRPLMRFVIQNTIKKGHVLVGLALSAAKELIEPSDRKLGI